ncbi:MAG: metallopeptidase family protein [Planctomycetota bacterium]
MTVTDLHRDRFDTLLQEVLETLPPAIAHLLDEVAVIVDDEPEDELAAELMAEMDLERDEIRELCGLHTGTALTERSVEQVAEPPEHIHLFRRGIIEVAGGWADPEAEDHIADEIAITLLHEIGHHFGLDEDDLARLGYD